MTKAIRSSKSHTASRPRRRDSDCPTPARDYVEGTPDCIQETIAQYQQVSASSVEGTQRNMPMKKSRAMRTWFSRLSDKPWATAGCATVTLTGVRLPVARPATGFRPVLVSRRWGSSENRGCLPATRNQSGWLCNSQLTSRSVRITMPVDIQRFHSVYREITCCNSISCVLRFLLHAKVAHIWINLVNYLLESKGFWRRCTTLITGFQDFVQCPEF
jgi:hypothetical protein